MAKFWRSHRITICLLLCLLLLGGDSLDISSNTGDKDQPILSVDAFFDKLDTINDLNQLVKILGTCERLQQLKFVREQLNLRSDQQQLVDQEHQELIIKLYRQLFGLSSSYNLKKDLTASKTINSLLQKFTPDELLDQFQNHLPSPNDIIAPRRSSYRERLAGFATFTNIIWAISIFLLVSSIASLFIALNLFALIQKIILWVPIAFWEFLAHTTCFSIIYYAGSYDINTSHRNYITLTGCLLWYPAWLWFFSRRESILRQNSPENYTIKVLIVIYVIVAIQYQSHVIGTLAVYVMLASLGFSGHCTSPGILGTYLHTQHRHLQYKMVSAFRDRRIFLVYVCVPYRVIDR
ncbi:4800_t:CDS:2 [Entrophospora sp. SA101]|nr:4800_t:CDS:2 [Entrophospora sp. SA101]